MKYIIFLPVIAILASCNNKPQDNSKLRAVLLQQLKNTHTNEDWFAPVNKSVQDLTADQANWKDSTENHSIGQLVSHLVFWNERNLKTFQGIKVAEFDGNNDNTFKQLTSEEWSNSVSRLDSIETAIEKIVEDATDEQLTEWSGTLANIASHNAYHTGQIIYIRKQQGWWKPLK